MEKKLDLSWGVAQSVQTSPGRWMDCRAHRNLLWSAKGTGSLEEVFPTLAGASIPKLPSFTVQSRPAFDRKEQAINTRSRSA